MPLINPPPPSSHGFYFEWKITTGKINPYVDYVHNTFAFWGTQQFLKVLARRL